MYKPKLTDYLPEFTRALEAQLKKEDKIWGDAWKQAKNPETRIFSKIQDYMD